MYTYIYIYIYIVIAVYLDWQQSCPISLNAGCLGNPIGYREQRHLERVLLQNRTNQQFHTIGYVCAKFSENAIINYYHFQNATCGKPLFPSFLHF